MKGQAVEDLYRVHHGWLVSLLRRKTGNVDQAADLAHDTFERVLRDDILAIMAAPRACLTNIARTLTIGYFRRAAVEAAYCDVLARQPIEVAPSPEEQALVVEAVMAVCAVLDGLSVHVHRVFMLSQVQGLSQPEIARELGISTNAVQKALSKALQHCYLAIYG
ncbi:sigma-70 family RNA polymerase sigma factor [Achromobacter seleniivolatilans]|uniref:Sigma-70 family RNA polymerase sigma factor n=1 Tax=Achromobacter seleniivolatilans TaxID=3047478 RepID=A0ABY9M358_9BURK|nr:sigma-70 family RNA polymerase sigma factor [Achromobacter sp. R39]WMD20282.1 sigma-70 family RNA polymerase sigma factor [Achromobacter sp. R39]